MIKIGIIGMGIRGTMFADTIRENAFAEIVAVAEYNQETLQAAIENYQVAGYQDCFKMMDEVEMDGVIVSTPDFLHKDAVIYAANKGIFLYFCSRMRRNGGSNSEKQGKMSGCL